MISIMILLSLIFTIVLIEKQKVYSVGRHILIDRKAMKEKEGILKDLV